MCQILNDILRKCENNDKITWPKDDGCHDYWETIAEIAQRRHTKIAIKWMPSHLDETAKCIARTAYLAEGGCEQWILGNCGADEMAKNGAELAAPLGICLQGKE